MVKERAEERQRNGFGAKIFCYGTTINHCGTVINCCVIEPISYDTGINIVGYKKEVAEESREPKEGSWRTCRIKYSGTVEASLVTYYYSCVLPDSPCVVIQSKVPM